MKLHAMTAPMGGIPRLCSGDRLSRDEFERRHAAMPECKKAELIEGVVHVTSAVSVRHGQPHSQLGVWLGTYAAATPKVASYDHTTLRLDLDNEPQPDLLLRIVPEGGGRCRVTPDLYLEGPPELVAEITASTASCDLHGKLNAYRRNGIREFLVWRVMDGAVDWFAHAALVVRLQA
jgi:Uma2 family endonuclease